MTFLGLMPDEWFQVGVSLAIVMISILIGRWVVRLFLEQIVHRLVKRTKTTLDETLWKVLNTPIYWFIIVFAVDFGTERLDFIPAKIQSVLNEIYYVLYFLIGIMFILRLVSELFRWYRKGIDEKADPHLAKQMLPFLRRVALIVIATIALVSLLGRYTDISALLATLGVTSLAFALAAQTALEDLFSGFLIMLDRPFRVGDRIEIQDLDTWGDVSEIGLRSTRIRTRDNRMVILANSKISKSMIVNHAYPDTQYRIQVEIGVDYDADIELARKTIVETVQKVDGVLQNRPVEALLLAFGESALIFRVRWWIESYVDTRRMFDNVNTSLYEALTQAGVSLPYPQLEVRHYLDPERITDIIQRVRRENPGQQTSP
jgi:small-conductance mechanosensitive channel